MPNLDRALVAPASVFASPDDVVRHPRLTMDCKREILWRWACPVDLKRFMMRSRRRMG
ncbi:hypothetical protein [Microvirga sp. P5_D2]